MNTIFDATVHVLMFPLNPERRIYWLFLVCSAPIALVYLRFQASEQARSHWCWSVVFSPAYWWHRSARIDYAMLFVNAIIGASIVVPLLGSSLALAVALQPLLHTALSPAIFGGSAPQLQLPTGAVIAIFSVAAFLAEDASRYWLHRLMHKNYWLWQFHRVHHGAEVLNPVTLYRIHPVEMLLFRAREVVVCGSLGALFMTLYPNQIREWEILGTGLFNFLFNIAGANLRHSPIPLHFGIFERWFVSPAQHQLHHSIKRHHQQSNYGSNLAIWDRFFGSWIGSEKEQSINIGLAHPLPSTLLAQYTVPFSTLLKPLIQRRSSGRLPRILGSLRKTGADQSQPDGRKTEPNRKETPRARRHIPRQNPLTRRRIRSRRSAHA